MTVPGPMLPAGLITHGPVRTSGRKGSATVPDSYSKYSKHTTNLDFMEILRILCG